MTVESSLCEVLEDHTLRCLACAHRCLLREGRRGICGVRFNRGGKLHVPFGYVAGAQVDPIGKQQLDHFVPGSEVLTFGLMR